MTDTKLSALTAQTGAGLADGDLFLTVDVSDTTMAASGTDKKITKSELISALGLSGVGVVLECNTLQVEADDGLGVRFDTAYTKYYGAVILTPPAGLGLTYALDGSTGVLTATEAGVWLVDYSLEWPTDATATVVTWMGASTDPLYHALSRGPVSSGTGQLRVTSGGRGLALPAGGSFAIRYLSEGATAAPYSGPNYGGLKIVRLA